MGSSESRVAAQDEGDEESAIGESTGLVKQTAHAAASEEALPEVLSEPIAALDVQATNPEHETENKCAVAERLRYNGKLYILIDSSDSIAMVADPAYLRAARRMGAILVTFAIELRRYLQVNLL
jgi:hypothetical protein